MTWVKVSVAVLLTSAALVVALFVTGAVLVGSALASDAPAVAHARATDDHNLPPELAGLKDIPAAERFAHFKGVQISLTDKDGTPVEVAVTPGVASTVSATSLTVAGNDGASHTYSVNDQTMHRGGPIASGDKVVVVTINNSSTARAAFSLNAANWQHGPK